MAQQKDPKTAAAAAAGAAAGEAAGAAEASKEMDPGSLDQKKVPVTPDIEASAVPPPAGGGGEGSGADPKKNENENENASPSPSPSSAADKLKGRRTKWEYMELGLGFLAFKALVANSYFHLKDCTPIPSLPIYVLAFGGVKVLSRILIFAFRTRLRKQADEEAGMKKEHPAVRVANILALCGVGLAIWGAICTWGNFHKAGRGEEYCSPRLFYPAFITSVIQLIGVVGMLLYFALKKTGLWAATGRKTGGGEEDAGTEEEGTASRGTTGKMEGEEVSESEGFHTV